MKHVGQRLASTACSRHICGIGYVGPHLSTRTLATAPEPRECPFHQQNNGDEYDNKIKTSNSQQESDTDKNDVSKVLTDIPGPRGLPVFGSALEFLVPTRHRILERRSKEYGPIFRERVGPMQSVNLCDPTDVEHALRNEGKHPHRLEVPPWKEYRQMKGLPFGLVISNGPEWQKARSAVNKPMMKQKVILKYLDDMNEVVDDAVRRFKLYRNGEKVMPDLDQEFFHWSIESVGTVMFETRLGCLEDQRPQIATDFVQSVRKILAPNKLLFVNPGLARKLGLRCWKEHEAAWDKIYEIGKVVIEKRMIEMDEERKRGKEVEGVLVSLLENADTNDPVMVNTLVTDLFLGAVDTSPNTMQFALLLLAKNRDKQEKLRREINNIVKPGSIVKAKDLQSLPFLKAIFKEALRMYPIVPTFGKIYTQEMTIRDYKIPADTMVNVVCCAMGRDPKLFKDPEIFRPERWLKDGEEKEDIHPFSSIPFGYGKRSCIGRRIAELQMYLLLARLTQSFDIHPTDGDKPIEAKVKLLMCPKTTPLLRFDDI
ncbi:1,25-dihydroxyvitamin D(3) 24-hydroxylase, mitochondrial-like [Tubulanus polymorphus]|uniref:1,25-dihydroxyvitamin D(3) 24-hydroxylase, mitochondrial-like n=1 Tax=Tubulanus polymorphus TaxID=672921 RepID=UPI003DA6971C